MKSWLHKFRISHELDERRGRPLAGSTGDHGSVTARQFAAENRALEAMLKCPRPAVIFPATLHDSIMRSLEAATATPVHHGEYRGLRWKLSVSFSALAVVVVCLAVWRSSAPRWPVGPNAASSLTVATSALQTAGDLIQTAPVMALSPMTDETKNLQTDLDRAGQFLYASLP